MPRTSFPRDRFDDIADTDGRLGAHRAENPRMRGGVVFLWAAVATVVLVVVGIFGTLVVSGRISLVPDAIPTAGPAPQLTPLVDPSYDVLVLNAAGQQGLATQTADTIVAAGWAAETVSAGEAQSDFDTTTVYYVDAEDAAAAAGLAEVIGGAQVAQSDVYAQADDPGTERDETRILTVVLGLDRVQPAQTPAE